MVVASPCGRHAHPSTLAAKKDSVGQWYLGQKNRTSRRFSSGLRAFARHVERKMTIVVLVVPLANRVNVCGEHGGREARHYDTRIKGTSCMGVALPCGRPDC